MEKKRTRIKIHDLPKDMKISKDELKRIKGGAYTPFMNYESPFTSSSYARIRYPSTFIGLKI